MQFKNKEIFNMVEACKFLGVGPLTFKNLIKNGEIPVRKGNSKNSRYYISKASLVRWLEGPGIKGDEFCQ